MNIKLIPIVEEVPEAEAQEEKLGPADLALMAGAICAALAAFALIWKWNVRR